MCWVCDHPEATRQDRLEYVRELLEAYCWIVIGVRRERYRPPYSYTVGLTDHGKPELVLTGLPQHPAADLLNDAAARALQADVPSPGESMPLAAGPLVEVVQVAEPSVHLDVAAEFYGRQLQARQLVYADDRGRWPWDAGFRDGRGGQPVLGRRAAKAA